MNGRTCRGCEAPLPYEGHGRPRELCDGCRQKQLAAYYAANREQLAARKRAHATSRLRAERERQELTLRELAHFAGCSHMTIQRLEVGTLNVTPSTRARIARALRVPVAELWPAPDEREATASSAAAAAIGTVEGRLEDDPEACDH